uniref:DNA-directed RNA polymerase subunit beta'' n=1 Tax=Ishige okamurae TaxID=233772 RepID=A0A8E6D2G6_9PHAE|nr:RNA polymerase beta'' subunit [Ishige okamurae]QVJ99583.1 RNA polymerase beta'' subunit [Ishige okamurae]
MRKKSRIFCNKIVNKQELKKLISWAFKNYGQRKAVFLVDQLKALGFEYATKSGISISLEDLKVPPVKTFLMTKATQDVIQTEFEVNNGEITEVERFQKIIRIWNNTSEDLKDRVVDFFKTTDPLNSVYIMAFSGARGSLAQVRQLVGMRGLMADPNGQIIDLPITTNFREGLSVTDYIISSYGARKGIVDTAIKTADSGYLTRRLVEVAQGIIISERDCYTRSGLLLRKRVTKNEVPLSLKQRAIGRVLANAVFSPKNGQILGKRNQCITPHLAEEFTNFQIPSILIRSPLTCECRRSVCQQCYGWNLASAKLVDLGESIGIVAAQSIGEPGTQLTMRTFHTGGVFTSEKTRQVRANHAGYINFLPTMKARFIRTNYGQDALINDRDSHIQLITYSNEIKKIKVSPETIILVKNKIYVKKNDVLLEFTSRTRNMYPAEKEVKYVLAKHGGEIVSEEKGYRQPFDSEQFKVNKGVNRLFWILSGQVYDIPIKAKINARTFQKVYKNQSLAQSRIVTMIGGFVSFLMIPSTEKVLGIKINNSFRITKQARIFIERSYLGIRSCKMYFSRKSDISINFGLSHEQHFLLGYLNSRKFKTRTAGTFYTDQFYNSSSSNNHSERRTRSGGTVFYLPKSTVETTTAIRNFKFKKRSFVSRDKEVFPNFFTSVEGFVNFETKNKIKEVSIKPGLRYFLKNSIVDVDTIDQQLYYPGEILFKTIEIKKLSYLEIESITKRGIYIYVRPITRYEVTRDNSRKFLQRNYFGDIKLKVGNFVMNATSGINLKGNGAFQFIYSPVVFDYPLHSNNSEIRFEFRNSRKRKSWSEVFLNCSQTFLIDPLIPKELKKDDISVNLLVQNEQFVEPYSTLIAIDIVARKDNFIYEIKQKYTGKKRTIIMITKADHKSIYLDDFDHPYRKDQFIKRDQKFGGNLTISSSGLIKKVDGNKLLYHLGQPYLFSQGAFVNKLPGDFIKTHENLGQLVYERLKTGDIVQGLPKVEEILEARNPKNQAVLSKRPGLIYDIDRDIPQSILISARPSSLYFGNYFVSKANRLLVKKFDFVNVGQPLTEGPLNPHNLLDIYFQYFCSLNTLSLYQSAYFSIKKVQSFLISSVQSIYFSQGVIISDKHIELIIREMTSKIWIEDPGETNFLPGDILDLEQANFINLSLRSENKILFRPILFGITKSSLKADSFLAAASFQETTRVLTNAAVQGKTDWLRGLKENVITGRLITAGTGFYLNNDLTYKKALLPPVVSSPEQVLNLRDQLNSRFQKPKISFKVNK